MISSTAKTIRLKFFFIILSLVSWNRDDKKGLTGIGSVFNSLTCAKSMLTGFKRKGPAGRCACRLYGSAAAQCSGIGCYNRQRIHGQGAAADHVITCDAADRQWPLSGINVPGYRIVNTL